MQTWTKAPPGQTWAFGAYEIKAGERMPGCHVAVQITRSVQSWLVGPGLRPGRIRLPPECGTRLRIRLPSSWAASHPVDQLVAGHAELIAQFLDTL